MSVDGDFGSETEGNVKKFQTQAALEPTGIVDTATWKVLGPIGPRQMKSRSPEPAVANTDKSEKQPMNSSTGSPFVTANPGRSLMATLANSWPAAMRT